MYYAGIVFVLLFSLLPFGISLLRWRTLDLPSRIFSVLLGFVFAVECVATFSAIRYQNNMAIYNVSGWLQMALICLYFNYSIYCFKRLHLGIYMAVASIVLGVVNALYFEPLGKTNTFYLTYQAVLVLLLGILLYTELLLKEGYVNTYRSVHFWLVLILVLFNSLTLVNFSLYDFLADLLSGSVYLLAVYIWICGALANLGFTLVFIFYNRLNPTYGE